MFVSPSKKFETSEYINKILLRFRRVSGDQSKLLHAISRHQICAITRTCIVLTRNEMDASDKPTLTTLGFAKVIFEFNQPNSFSYIPIGVDDLSRAKGNA